LLITKILVKINFIKRLDYKTVFLDKNNHPCADKLEQIIYTYPEINIEWLLTGQGSMLREKTANQPIGGSGNFSSNFSGSIGSVNGSGEDVYKLLKDKDAQINKPQSFTHNSLKNTHNLLMIKNFYIKLTLI
jgi:hypothetical protein